MDEEVKQKVNGSYSEVRRKNEEVGRSPEGA